MILECKRREGRGKSKKGGGAEEKKGKRKVKRRRRREEERGEEKDLNLILPTTVEKGGKDVSLTICWSARWRHHPLLRGFGYFK